MLSGIAQSVLTSAQSRNLSPEYLKLSGLPHEKTHDALDDIRQELALFILENRRLHKVLSESKNFSTYLKTAFINRWIGKTRLPHADPWRSLYKRAATVLRRSADFHISTRRGGGTAFSMAVGHSPVPPLSSEDMEEIPFPDEMLEKREIDFVKKGKIMLELASYFWRQVSGAHGDKPVLVDLRDFIEWIRAHVMLSPMKMETKSPGGGDPLDLAIESGANPEKIYFDNDLVSQWAKNFAGRLTRTEKMVAYLVHQAGLSLKDIAMKLGYRGPSGPKYQLDRFEDKLRFFLRDLPWLSPDDLNEEAFSFFLESLFLILKTSLDEP